MKRRDFLGMLSAAAAWPGAISAQQRIPVVGFLGFATPAIDDRHLAALPQGDRRSRLCRGAQHHRRSPHANGDITRGLALIDEFAAMPVDVLLAPGPAAARAAVRKTKIPVVAIALPAVQSDPELFQSLARPGGTLTGFSAFGEEMSAKRIEMLKEILPGLTKLGVMHNATDPTFSAWGDQTMADTQEARHRAGPRRADRADAGAGHRADQETRGCRRHRHDRDPRLHDGGDDQRYLPHRRRK